MPSLSFVSGWQTSGKGGQVSSAISMVESSPGPEMTEGAVVAITA